MSVTSPPSVARRRLRPVPPPGTPRRRGTSPPAPGPASPVVARQRARSTAAPGVVSAYSTPSRVVRTYSPVCHAPTEPVVARVVAGRELDRALDRAGPYA
ncbi:MAG: hypothetical protein H6719_35465 [Sandaracinaceae bacterium]|nr:hypothetical protein [Sandaracinaceae bacterium]